jgi:hypothetical protein
MTQIGVPYRIAVETLKNMDDNTKQNLVLPLNQFNEQINNAFNKSISINDNTTSQIVTQRFTSGVSLIIRNPLSTVPVGVIPIAGNGANQFVESIYLTPQSDQNKIAVTVNWQPNSYVGDCTFILIGG